MCLSIVIVCVWFLVVGLFGVCMFIIFDIGRMVGLLSWLIWCWCVCIIIGYIIGV